MYRAIYNLPGHEQSISDHIKVVFIVSMLMYYCSYSFSIANNQLYNVECGQGAALYHV